MAGVLGCPLETPQVLMPKFRVASSAPASYPIRWITPMVDLSCSGSSVNFLLSS